MKQEVLTLAGKIGLEAAEYEIDTILSKLHELVRPDNRAVPFKVYLTDSEIVGILRDLRDNREMQLILRNACGGVVTVEGSLTALTAIANAIEKNPRGWTVHVEGV